MCFQRCSEIYFIRLQYDNGIKLPVWKNTFVLFMKKKKKTFPWEDKNCYASISKTTSGLELNSEAPTLGV